jgi:D-beta-D-heptose 7-phosphate kinase/D-beta-D-heptose 1-phosphate adenosyltransferase
MMFTMPTHSIDAICSVPTSGKWVLVIGDVMLDRYLVGDVQRISPEAPIPVVALTERYHRAGGAANVASNVAGLGVRVGLVGVVGTDPDAQVLEDLLDANNIQSYIVPLVHRVTTVKTRIMSTRQQIVRVDEESLHSFTPEEKDILRNTITRALAGRPSMVLLSDYAKGVLDVELCVWILDQCASLGIPALADPRGNDYSKYKGVMGLTPNKKETIEACGLVDGESTENIEIIGAALRLRLTHGFEFLAVTRGAEGISFIDAQGCRHIPAEARQVFDVSGAGDTVIAVLAVGILGGLSSFEALQVANIAAGIVVGKIGTAAITQEELLHKMSPPHVISGGEKIQSLPHVLETLTRWRNEGSTIVFTNGCFDLLHAGHVAYLEESKKAGDKLIVGLNTDESVRALKGV